MSLLATALGTCRESVAQDSFGLPARMLHDGQSSSSRPCPARTATSTLTSALALLSAEAVTILCLPIPAGSDRREPQKVITTRESRPSLMGAAGSVDRWRLVAERAAPWAGVVVPLPAGDYDVAWARLREMLTLRHSLRIQELNDST